MGVVILGVRFQREANRTQHDQGELIQQTPAALLRVFIFSLPRVDGRNAAVLESDGTKQRADGALSRGSEGVRST